MAGVQFGTTVAIANWFVRKRGRAMAVGGSGLRMGQAALPLLIHAVIIAMSWRHAFAMLAVMSLLFIAVPAFLFIRRRPEGDGPVAGRSGAAGAAAGGAAGCCAA